MNPDTNVNYLVPTDLDEADTDNVWYRSIEQQGLIDLLSQRAPNATHFVVFDACRNELNLSGRAAKGLGAEKGFVPVNDVSGILIAYATAQKKTAADTGIFARILAEELVKPGVEAFSVFREVQVRVEETMHQEPWMSLNYIPRIYLAGAPGVPERATPSRPAPQAPYSEAAQAWAEIKDLKDASIFEAFRKQYGVANALYDTLAAQRIAGLQLPRPPGGDDTCDGLRVSVALSGEKPCIKPGSGESFKDCPDCPEIVIAPSGSFMMGSPSNEPERESVNAGSESPQHEVTIAKPFAIGKFDITRGQFARFVEATGHKTEGGCYVWSGRTWKHDNTASWRSPGFSQDDTHPAVCVNWEDARAYVAWISKVTGKQYRLLSEAEYEYATRAGTTTPFWWGASITTEQANYDGTFVYAGGGSPGEWRKKTVPVESFKPNPWGLYQVHGNAWSWVEDCWRDSYSGAPDDGSAWRAGECKYHVLRGGSWDYFPQALRAAFRISSSPDDRFNNLGFRVARELNP